MCPPLPLEATPGFCQKNKMMQTTESGISKTTPSGPTSETSQPKLSLPVSTEPNTTSRLAGEFDTVEIEAPKILLLGVIEHEYPESKTLQPDVIQPKAPQLTTHVTLGPSSSLSLSLTLPQPIHLGPDGEEIPPGLLSIEEITQEESRPSSPIHMRGYHIYQAHLFTPPHTFSQAPLSDSSPFNSPLSFP